MHTTDHRPEFVGYNCRAINHPTCLALPFCIAIATSWLIAGRFRVQWRISEMKAASSEGLQFVDRFNKEDDNYVGIFLFSYRDDYILMIILLSRIGNSTDVDR